MPTIETQHLTGAALDWAVAQCEIAAGHLTTDPDNFEAPLIQIHSPESFNSDHGPGVFYPHKVEYTELGWEHHRRNPENWPAFKHSPSAGAFKPSADWAWAGPIIEREEISTAQNVDTKEWLAGVHGRYGLMSWTGTTPIIAAMRCYVAYKLGPTVDVPEELAQ